MRSTDCGCAFLIEYQGHLVYHAGDLHWWCWSGEPEETSRQMTANFKKEMETIAGRDIEIAFVPLDGRLEDNYGLGMQYLLEQAHVHHVFPMHFWDKPEVMDRYLQEYPVPEHTRFHRIIKDGESWDICDI
jgi:L-ascorbate metabolism protein UlaG (beta-lactamase superfamily)